MQDPESYLEPLGVELVSAVSGERKARIDREHCVCLNWESFFFADSTEKELFTSDPTHYCGLLTDPVTQARFQPGKHSPRYEYNGRVFFFASDSTRAVFRTMPDSLWVPHFAMPAMD